MEACNLPHNHKTLNAINGIILYDFALFLKCRAYACVEVVSGLRQRHIATRRRAYACVEVVGLFVHAPDRFGVAPMHVWKWWISVFLPNQFKGRAYAYVEAVCI